MTKQINVRALLGEPLGELLIDGRKPSPTLRRQGLRVAVSRFTGLRFTPVRLATFRARGGSRRPLSETVGGPGPETTHTLVPTSRGTGGRKGLGDEGRMLEFEDALKVEV